MNFLKSQVWEAVKHDARSALIYVAIWFTFTGLMHHFFPVQGSVNAPVAVVTPAPSERETQALIDAVATLAAKNDAVSPLQAPAVQVIRESGLANGLSNAQIAQLLGALKPKTAEKVAVASHLVAPTPAPTPNSAVYQQVYAADYAATTHALNETHIKTDVTISREVIPPSRVGSWIAPQASGLSFGVVRRHQYELDLAALLHDNHVVPGASLQYLIPNTSLSIGPSIFYDKGAHIGAAAVVHF